MLIINAPGSDTLQNVLFGLQSPLCPVYISERVGSAPVSFCPHSAGSPAGPRGRSPGQGLWAPPEHPLIWGPRDATVPVWGRGVPWDAVTELCSG